ncbi:hypothetical protein [Nocardiopsis alba]|uniref:hypothetical protein n=1 Tax=Nocardiopsis alba TaxID=53437 RepID=UPI0033EDB8B6
MADPDLHTGHMMTRWGHSSDHTDAHAAPRLQAQCPHSVIWFGDTSVHFYAMEAAGLHERPTLEALVFLLWQPRPRGMAAVSARETPDLNRSGSTTSSSSGAGHAPWAPPGAHFESLRGEICTSPHRS